MRASLLLVVLAGYATAYHPLQVGGGRQWRWPWSSHRIRYNSRYQSCGLYPSSDTSLSGAEPSSFSTAALIAELPESLEIPDYGAFTSDPSNVNPVSPSDLSSFEPPPLEVTPSPLTLPSDSVDQLTITGSSEDMRQTVESVGDYLNRHSSLMDLIHNPPRQPGGAPTLAEYILEGRFNPQAIIEKLQNLKGLNVDDFKLIMPGGFDAEEVQNLLQKIPVEKMAQSIQNFVFAVQSQGLTADSLRALSINELGGWYAGALGLLLLISTQSNWSVISNTDMTTQPTLKETAIEETLSVQTWLSEKERMEKQVKELSVAAASVSKELMALKVEKANRDYSLAEMKSELRVLKNQIQSQQLKETEIVSKLTKAESQFQTETDRLKSELEERESAEKLLLDRIRELQKQLGVEVESERAPEAEIKPEVVKVAAPKPASKPKVKPAAPKAAPEPELKIKPEAVKVAAPKASRTRKASSKTKTSSKVVEKVGEALSEPDQESSLRPAPEPVTVQPRGIYFASVEEPIGLVEPEKIQAKSSKSSTKTAAKKTKPKAVPKAAVTNASETEQKATKTTTSSKVKGSSTKTLSATEKSKAKESSTTRASKASTENVKEPVTPLKDVAKLTVTVSPAYDWSQLTSAAIKRKTVSELAGFLESRGATAKDDSGKPLKKADLIDKVLSIF